MEILDLTEKHYFFELERKDKLNTQASFTAVLAGLYLSLANLLISKIEIVSINGAIGFIFLVLSGAAFTIFVVQFISFFGHSYYYVADAEEMGNAYFRASDYDGRHPPSTEYVDLFSRNLAESYARSAAANRRANILKAALLLRSNQSVFTALIFGAASFLFRYTLSA